MDDNDAITSSSPLALVRRVVHSPVDAIRWACILEATAPKVGNVHPTASFEDLNFGDFVSAANITAEQLFAPERDVGGVGKMDTATAVSLGARMRAAVVETGRACGTNVNLGIVLLIGPLLAAGCRRDRIGEVIERLDREDSEVLFQTIAETAGGLGEVDELDVRDSSPRRSRDVSAAGSDFTAGSRVGLIAAMRLAADRDRIALQYANEFCDLYDCVIPLLRECLNSRSCLLAGIVDAQIRLLRQQPDSLVIRKCGPDVASELQRMALRTDLDDPASIAELDCWMRRDGHRRNPGTTADLIAAGLVVLLWPKAD